MPMSNGPDLVIFPGAAEQPPPPLSVQGLASGAFSKIQSA
jgi:hypothetical protein